MIYELICQTIFSVETKTQNNIMLFVCTSKCSQFINVTRTIRGSQT